MSVIDNKSLPLLDDGSQLADSSALLSQNIIGLSGLDDDLGLGGGDSHLNTGITILSKLTSEKLKIDI